MRRIVLVVVMLALPAFLGWGPAATAVQQPATRYYFTAGLLGSHQIPLPNDYPLDVWSAVAQVHGPVKTDDPTVVCEVIRETLDGTTTFRVKLGSKASEKFLVLPGDTIQLRRLIY